MSGEMSSLFHLTIHANSGANHLLPILLSNPIPSSSFQDTISAINYWARSSFFLDLGWFNDMEGLIPLVYRAILQYRAGGATVTVSWHAESPPASYVRLAGDSGRFEASELHLCLSELGLTSSSSNSPPCIANMATTMAQSASSPLCRSASRRPAAA